MIYHPRTPREAVNLRKEHADTAVYLAGGTDDLRLGGAAEGKDLIDITGFDFNTITEKDGKVYIGALCTLQDVIESELVPAFIREAAGFCASFAKRNSATVGGNLGLRRSDSYLAAALTAADAVLKSITPHGEQDKPVGEYLQSDCKRLIEYVVVDKDRLRQALRQHLVEPRDAHRRRERRHLRAERAGQRPYLRHDAGHCRAGHLCRRPDRQRRL